MPSVISRAGFLLFIIALLYPASAYSQDLEYQVKSGDTLYSIARHYSVSLQDLMALNDISDATSLKIGQMLRIPNNDDSTPSYNLENYEIRGGDTLYAISRRTGMDVSEILRINNLSEGAVIKPGQIIKVKALPPGQNSPADIKVSQTSTNQVETDPTPAPSAGGDGLLWPHNGERFVSTGKFPGVVIPGKEGDDIYSVSAGRVVYSGPHSTLGNVVYIQNPRGYIYIYGGNRELFVDLGD